MPSQSGIVVPVPDAEAVVAGLRAVHDGQARYGVPAHITLLYPFASPSRASESLHDLEGLFSRVHPFDFSLVDVRRFPGTVYLHPEPADRFVQLTGMLAERWPTFPPYGGAYATVVPHLTVADHVGAKVMDLVSASLAGQLPIHCRATEAWLMCSDEEGIWSRRASFGFGA